MYNDKYHKTWDESLPYIQHSYNQAHQFNLKEYVWSLLCKFKPLAPIDLVSRPSILINTYHEQLEVNNALKFKDRVCDI